MRAAEDATKLCNILQVGNKLSRYLHNFDVRHRLCGKRHESRTAIVLEHRLPNVTQAPDRQADRPTEDNGIVRLEEDSRWVGMAAY